LLLQPDLGGQSDDDSTDNDGTRLRTEHSNQDEPQQSSESTDADDAHSAPASGHRSPAPIHAIDEPAQGWEWEQQQQLAAAAAAEEEEEEEEEEEDVVAAAPMAAEAAEEEVVAEEVAEEAEGGPPPPLPAAQWRSLIVNHEHAATVSAATSSEPVVCVLSVLLSVRAPTVVVSHGAARRVSVVPPAPSTE
jgi:hypothetical protein